MTWRQLYGTCTPMGSFCSSREQPPRASWRSGGCSLGPDGQVHHSLEQLSQAVVRVNPEGTIKRDSIQRTISAPPGERREHGQGRHRPHVRQCGAELAEPVSYTHLTLPTIYSV